MKTLCRFCIVLFAVSVTNPDWAGNFEPKGNPSDSRSEVPFKSYAGFLIVIPGRVGEFEQLKFVLDTGATHSVLDRKLADRLGLRRRSGHVLNFDKTVAAEWAEVPDVQFGQIQVPHFAMMIGDLRYFQSFATKVDAVIGLDLLRSSSFSIDYDAHRVLFGTVDTASGVPMSSTPVCLSVRLRMGDSEFRLLVDTGAPALVLYEDRVVGRLPQLKIEGELEGTSTGGYVHSKRAFLRKVRLGTTDLNGTVFLVKAPPDKVLPGIDGYLGIAALKARRVDFNFDTNTLAWKR